MHILLNLSKKYLALYIKTEVRFIFVGDIVSP